MNILGGGVVLLRLRGIDSTFLVSSTLLGVLEAGTAVTY